MLSLVSYQTFKSIKTLKILSEKITKADKNVANNLDYEGIKLPVSKKDFRKIEKKEYMH